MVAAARHIDQQIPIWEVLQKPYLYGAYKRLEDTLPGYGAMLTYWDLAAIWCVSRSTAIKYARELNNAGVLQIIRPPRAGKMQTPNWYVIKNSTTTDQHSTDSGRPKLVLLPPKNSTTTDHNLTSNDDDDDDDAYKQITVNNINTQKLLAAGLHMPTASEFDHIPTERIMSVIAEANKNKRLNNKAGWIVTQLRFAATVQDQAAITPTERVQDQAAITPTERVQTPWKDRHRPDEEHTIANVWEIAHDMLEIHFDRPTFDIYLKDVLLVDYDPYTLTFTLAVKHAYTFDQVRYRLHRIIQREISDTFGQDVQIAYVTYDAWREQTV